LALLPRVRNWLAPALLVAALAGPALDPSLQFHFRDTGRFEYPVKQLLSEGLHRFELPLWNPWAEAGESLTGQLGFSLWHPTTLLYAALPLDWAFKLQHLSAFLLALWGMYALARRLAASREAAAAAATAFCGSGFLVSMVSCNTVFALGLAALPLALERLLAFLSDRRPLTLLCGAAALASCSWAGDPQAMLFGGYIGLGGALQWGVKRKLAGKAFALTALWGACALLLSSPSFLPAVPRFAASARTSGTPESLDDFALRPLRLAGVALPWAFDDTLDEGREATYPEYLAGNKDEPFAESIMLGLPVLLLALASGKRGRLALGAGCLLLVCACGNSLWAGKALYAALPGLKLFRYPEKLVAPATLLFCAAAALGVDAAAREPRRFLRLALLAAALLSLIAVLAPFMVPPGRTGSVRLAANLVHAAREACAAEALLCILLALAVRRPAWVAPLCALASFLAVRSVISLAPLDALHGPFPLATHLESEAGPSAGRWRVLTQGNVVYSLPGIEPRVAMTAGSARSLLPDFNSLSRIESVVPFASLNDLDYEHAWLAAPRAMEQLFGVRFELWPPQARERPGQVRGPYGILEKQLPAQPRAFLLPCARLEPDAAALARELARPGFDPHREAFVRKAVALSATCGGEPVMVPVVRPGPARMSLEADPAGPSLLVVAEHFEAGWHARIDGQETEVLQVDLGAQGVVLPAGRHRVELRFNPPYLLPGFVVALLCAVILLLLEVRFRRANRPLES
jgi:hypothetical protein